MTPINADLTKKLNNNFYQQLSLYFFAVKKNKNKNKTVEFASSFNFYSFNFKYKFNKFLVTC